MSLTVNALRKLQQSGAFPTPAKGEGDEASKKATADAMSDKDKADSPPQSEAVKPEAKPSDVKAQEQTDATQNSSDDATPSDAQLELEAPISIEPELERPETPVDDDLSVPSNDGLSAPAENQASPEISDPSDRRSPRSRTERLESSARSRPSKPTTPESDVPPIDPMMTMPIPQGGFKPEADEPIEAEPVVDEPVAEVPSVDPGRTMPIPRGGFKPEPEEEPVAQATAVDPTATRPLPPRESKPVVEPPADATVDPNMTMPIPPGGFKPEADEPEAVVPPVDPTMTMPISPPEAALSEVEPVADSSEQKAESPIDPSMTQPFPFRAEKNAAETNQTAGEPIGPESTRPPESDVTTPEQHQSQRSDSEPQDSGPTDSLQPQRPFDDDQVSPTLQTDIESLQAMVSEAVEETPAATGDQNLRPDGQHGNSRPSGNTERLESPGPGESVSLPVTTETYRLFYDPVIPTVDLDAADPTQTVEFKDFTPATSVPGLQSEPSGTEPFDQPATQSEPAPTSPVDAPTPEVGGQQSNSVVIPTAYERELIEQMSEKEFEKHFQNLQNQLGARSNHQMVGSYLFVSPTQTPRTADVTANLALLLEQYEREVLLIDANLEKQTLTRRFEALNHVGLCDILSGGTQPNDVVLPTSLRQLRFVPSGDDESGISRVPNRVDMHGIRQLLTAWCDDRRTIVCDAGSIDSAIALPMAQAFDGVILVVSLVDLNIDLVHAASRILTEHQVRNVLGCVVTDG